MPVVLGASGPNDHMSSRKCKRTISIGSTQCQGIAGHPVMTTVPRALHCKWLKQPMHLRSCSAGTVNTNAHRLQPCKQPGEQRGVALAGQPHVAEHLRTARHGHPPARRAHPQRACLSKTFRGFEVRVWSMESVSHHDSKPASPLLPAQSQRTSVWLRRGRDVAHGVAFASRGGGRSNRQAAGGLKMVAFCANGSGAHTRGTAAGAAAARWRAPRPRAPPHPASHRAGTQTPPAPPMHRQAARAAATRSGALHARARLFLPPSQSKGRKSVARVAAVAASRPILMRGCCW